MPDAPFMILSTRPLDESLLAAAAANNIKIDSVSFIRTEPVIDNLSKQRIASIATRSSTVIFTSMNAAEAVATYLEGSAPRWNIYCLGTATKKVVEQYFTNSIIVGEADNASLLADEIIKHKETAAIFFCGDQRRTELPDKLSGYGIPLEEIVVYSTITTATKIQNTYDGILFFSPSAVESFFSLNVIPQTVILFAIGSTTAACIRLYSNNNIIESNTPGKRNLVEQSINYFGKLNHTNEHIKK